MLCRRPAGGYDTPSSGWPSSPTTNGPFDEGHLELLRVLASEASIAIETRDFSRRTHESTAPLAAEHHLAQAIATLNPDEDARENQRSNWKTA